MEFCNALLFVFPLISMPTTKGTSLPRTIVTTATEKPLKYYGTLELQQKVITPCAHVCIHLCICYFAPWTEDLFSFL